MLRGFEQDLRFGDGKTPICSVSQSKCCRATVAGGELETLDLGIRKPDA